MQNILRNTSSAIVKNIEDLNELLDSLLREPTEFWDTFYKGKERNVPYICDRPDEHLKAT